MTTIFTGRYPQYPFANSTSGSGEYVVPDSCCKHLSNVLVNEDYENCRTQTASDGSGNLVGCYDAAVVEVVDQWLFVSIIVGIVAGVMVSELMTLHINIFFKARRQTWIFPCISKLLMVYSFSTFWSSSLLAS